MKYLIKLKPIGSYFFGKELIAELGNKNNYYMQSAFFPQQTTLLGFLRHQLLLQKELIPLYKNDNREEAKKLIGNKSFCIPKNDSTDEINDFGKIKKLSPVFLLKNDNDCEPHFLFNKHFVDYKGCDSRIKLDFENGIINSAGKEKKKIPYYYIRKNDKKVSYIAKYLFANSVVQPNNLNTEVLMENIFSNDERVGIQKEFEGKTEEKAYFKMAGKKLDKNWSFAFIVEISENADCESLNSENDIAIMGKERSAFKMEVTKIEDKEIPVCLKMVEEIDKPKETEEATEITLLSDAFIDNEKEFIDLCEFANITTVRFRSIINEIEKDHNYGKPNKSKAFNLLKRGSVIHTRDPQKIIERLTKGNISKHFYNIGYNHYYIHK